MATWSGKLSNLYTYWTSTPSNSVSSGTNEAGGKRAMMIFGACQFRGPTGKYKCPCEKGSCISSTSAVNLQMQCSECAHPLDQHSHYGEESSPPDHLLPPSASLESLEKTREDICPRRQTVETLVQMLNRYAVVHVRGTPATGKTTLARLLHRHLKRSHRVVYIGNWKRGSPAAEYLVEKCHKLGYTRVQDSDFFGSHNNDLLFIIDEAQVTYSDCDLWSTVIKSRGGLSYGPRFCLFSSYGSPRNGAPDFCYPTETTPPILRREQRVSLTIPPDSEEWRISLFYTRDEFEDVIAKFCDVSEIEFTLADDLQEYIFCLTNGHPGFVRETLNFIHVIYGDQFKRTEIREITLDHIRDYLEDDRKLLGYLETSPAGRALPSRETRNLNLDPDMIAVFLNILRDGSVKLDNGNAAMVRAFKLGFLHSEQITNDPDLICVLPSTIHARYVEFFFGTSNARPFPFNTYPRIHDLALAVIQRFSQNMLLMTNNNQRLGPAGKVRPPEACFQDEFYRCSWNVLGPGIGISSEWSDDGKGRIDFHIPKSCWGFELLRDGDRLKQHCDRFCPNGQYYPWIRQNRLMDWLILDCRTTRPRPHPGQPKLWRVVFKDNYSRVLILDCENKAVTPEFQLANA